MPSPTTYPHLSFSEVESSLPSPHKLAKSDSFKPRERTLVVLDDDPTGTQTVHDITVLTTYEKQVLKDQLDRKESGFFVLTNSRAYPHDDVPYQPPQSQTQLANTPQASSLMSALLKDLGEASAESGREIDIVLRSDSTLRGHFPLEPQLAEAALGPFSAWILAPAFFEGGRVTIDDVHYVREGDSLVPAAETPFAADKGFGFKSSNLREWIAEKFSWKDVPRIESISIADIRSNDGPERVASRLKEILSVKSSQPPVIILNGFAQSDFKTFAAGVRLAGDPRLLYRSGASIVSATLGIERIPPVSPEKLFSGSSDKSVGGLIIVGSYVPKTTAQRNYLLSRCKEHIEHFELDVEQLLSSQDQNAALISQTVQDIEKTLKSGVDVVLSTSRKLITSDDKKTSLEMGKIVSGVLNSIVKTVNVRPKYVIAKVSGQTYIKGKIQWYRR
jgi:uncharacterized protein YgbK (DUF1537 family)